MPNTHQYRDAASRYRTLSEHALREAAAPAAGALGFVGDGPAREALAGSLERRRVWLVAAGETLRRLATTCDDRAEVCARYASALARYRELSPHERLAVPAPLPPAPWVDA